MIHFVLDDLRRESREFLMMLFQVHVLVINLDLPVPRRLSRPTQGKAALFSLICTVLSRYDRIEHHHIGRTDIDDNNVLFNADHVGGHAHAAISVRLQRVQEIACRLKILFSGRF